ncbi:hypothetical protein DFJ73DRAFT_831508, partial [Zopfochytrium polystomum]
MRHFAHCLSLLVRAAHQLSVTSGRPIAFHPTNCFFLIDFALVVLACWMSSTRAVFFAILTVCHLPGKNPLRSQFTVYCA